jgi:hypothetical protein
VTRFRRLELRQCAGFARTARIALRAGDLRRAFRHHLLACRSLSLARAFGGGNSVTATATLCRVLTNLGDAIEDALIPPPKVEAWELVEEIVNGLSVLRTRDGVELTDQQIHERARNLATALTYRWRFTAIPESDASAHSPTAPQRHGN